MTLTGRLILAVVTCVGVAIVGAALIMGLLARNALIRQAEDQSMLVAGLIAGEANRVGAVSSVVNRLQSNERLSQAVALSHLVEILDNEPQTAAHHFGEITADTGLDDIWFFDRNGHSRFRLINGLVDESAGNPELAGIDQRILTVLSSGKRFTIRFRAMPAGNHEHPIDYIGIRTSNGFLFVGTINRESDPIGDAISLQATLNSLTGLQGVKAIWVVDDQMNVEGSVFVGLQDGARPAPLSQQDLALAQASLESGAHSHLDNTALHVAAPMMDHGGVVTGAAIIHMPRDQLDQLLEQYISYGIVVAAIAFAIGSIIATISAQRIARPVTALINAAGEMEQRRFEPASLDLVGQRTDEIGTLVRVFQRMAREVQAREEHLETLVRERTFDLQQKNEQLEEAHRRMDDELQIAHSLQGAILPKTLPAHSAFAGGAMMTPARELGGDFYDFFSLEDGRLGIVIADVSGKGVPAAFFMAIALTVMRSKARDYPDPGQCLREVNNEICEQNPHLLFVTVFYGILDPATGRFTYANAGHNPPYLIKDDGTVSPLPTTGGLVIGVMPDSDFNIHDMALVPGDRIFFYTDGISEAMNEDGEIFGESRVERVLEEGHLLPIDAVIENLTISVSKFVGQAPQSDDITCIAFGYSGISED